MSDKVTVTQLDTLHLAIKPHGDWLYTLDDVLTFFITAGHRRDCDVYSGDMLICTYRRGLLSIQKSYSYDGMSNWADSPKNLAGACLHDCIYQSGLFPRKIGDLLLRSYLEQVKDISSPPRLVYAGVQLFGAKHYGADSTIKIIEL
jgi:hypothetical protein